MKKLYITVALAIISIVSYSQDFSSSCTVPSFKYVYGYFQPFGAGVEIGIWPQENLIGGAIGFSLSNKLNSNNKTDATQDYWGDDIVMYASGLVRIVPKLTGVGYVGVKGIDKLYTGIGIRYATNINTKLNGFALIIEPTYTTDGFNANIGIGIAL